MRQILSTTALALVLAACSYNSAVETTESWTEVTPQQAMAPTPPRIDPYTRPPRAPQMRNGCATSVEHQDDILVIRHLNPREVYCFSVAPLRLTTIELPAGTVMTSAQSGMMQFLGVANADAGGRTTISLQSKCVPMRKDAQGKIEEPEIYERVDPQALPYCPRETTDLAVFTSNGPIYFRVAFNNTTRVRVVDVRSEPLAEPARPKVPVKTRVAQELYATSADGAVVPWTPDDAWATGDETVIAWHRPMGTLPSLHVGAGGEQVGVPTVIHEDRVIAMVYPRRLTEFQLRMNSRILQFSSSPPPKPRTTLF